MNSLEQKIVSASRLVRIIIRLKKKGKKIVFTNGCFDLLHYGHVNYLNKAKQRGDILIVGLNSDASVRRLKGKSRPILKQHDRAGVLAALSCTDFITIFSDATPRRVIQLVRPDVLVKGGDWKTRDIVGADIVTSDGGTVVAIPFIKGRSTSSIIKSIVKGYAKKVR